MSPQENKEQFFEAVGRAVTQWQAVEASLFEVFATIFDPKDSYIASAVFFAVTSFKAKLDMVNAAAHFTLDEDDWNQWKTLYNKAKKKSDVRNELVHFMAVGGYEDYVLRPNIFDAHALVRYSKEKGRTPPEFTRHDLIQKSQSFGRLS